MTPIARAFAHNPTHIVSQRSGASTTASRLGASIHAFATVEMLASVNADRNRRDASALLMEAVATAQQMLERVCGCVRGMSA